MSQTFTITNIGGGVLNWSIDGAALEAWITSVLPTSGSLAAGASEIVTIVADRGLMDDWVIPEHTTSGIHYDEAIIPNACEEDVIDVISNGGNDTVKAKIKKDAASAFVDGIYPVHAIETSPNHFTTLCGLQKLDPDLVLDVGGSLIIATAEECATLYMDGCAGDIGDEIVLTFDLSNMIPAWLPLHDPLNSMDEGVQIARIETACDNFAICELIFDLDVDNCMIPAGVDPLDYVRDYGCTVTLRKTAECTWRVVSYSTSNPGGDMHGATWDLGTCLYV